MFNKRLGIGNARGEGFRESSPDGILAYKDTLKELSHIVTITPLLMTKTVLYLITPEHESGLWIAREV